MLSKIKTIIVSLALLIMPVVSLAAPAVVMAQADCSSGVSGGGDCIQGGLCSGAQTLTVSAGAQPCTEQDSGLIGIVKTVVNILSVIVGVIAVIMIIVGGLRYIASGGKAESVTAAKNTILYALVGLVIVALAQVVVRFVLTRVTNSTS